MESESQRFHLERQEPEDGPLFYHQALASRTPLRKLEGSGASRTSPWCSFPSYVLPGIPAQPADGSQHVALLACGWRGPTPPPHPAVADCIPLGRDFCSHCDFLERIGAQSSFHRDSQMGLFGFLVSAESLVPHKGELAWMDRKESQGLSTIQGPCGHLTSVTQGADSGGVRQTWVGSCSSAH